MTDARDMGGTPHARKTALRHLALAKRTVISHEARQQAGLALASHLPDCVEAWRTARDGTMAPAGERPSSRLTVGAYVSMGTEIETRPLLSALSARGARVLVPRLGSGREIGWSVMNSIDDLASAGPGGRRPDEPTSAVLRPPAIADADIILVPALGVDRRGFRLGRGAGWYDRALALCKPSCLLVAVCWPWEITDSDLPREAHDIPVDATLTSEGFHMLASSLSQRSVGTATRI